MIPCALMLRKIYQTFTTANMTQSRQLQGDSSRENHTISLLREPVTIANVIPIPKIQPSDRVLFQTATEEFSVNGTGLLQAREVLLEFTPMLREGEDYEIISRLPLAADSFALHLLKGRAWRATPGPLVLSSIDTGAGPVLLNGAEGLKIGEVRANGAIDEGARPLYVEGTAAKQLLYHDDASLIITGRGFNPHGTALRFTNAITLTQYTTVITTDTQIDLRLKHGQYWFTDLANLPSTLTVAAVDVGSGFVEMGGAYVGKGRDVATVYERPLVHYSGLEIHQTKTLTLTLAGSGFTSSGEDLEIMFNPPLQKRTDYVISMVGRTSMQLTLVGGRRWTPDVVSTDGRSGRVLYVTAINTRGDDDGWVVLPGLGVQVAHVVDDGKILTNGGSDIASSLGLTTQQLYSFVISASLLVLCCPCVAFIALMLHRALCHKPTSSDYIRNSMDKTSSSSRSQSVGTIHLSPLSAASHYNPLTQGSQHGRRIAPGISMVNMGGDEDFDVEDDVVFTRTGI